MFFNIESSGGAAWYLKLQFSSSAICPKARDGAPSHLHTPWYSAFKIPPFAPGIRTRLCIVMIRYDNTDIFIFYLRHFEYLHGY
jgi:hypothetical protein